MEPTEQVETLLSKLKGHADTCYELLILKAAERVSRILSEMVSRMVLIPLVVFSLLFVSLAAAFYLSYALDNRWMGFLIVGLAYFSIALLLLFLRKSIIAHPLRDKLIKEMLKED